MADLTDQERAGFTKITGGDEAFVADVISEDGFNKLYVKATTVPEALGDLIFEHATNGGSEEMAVNGSVTPVEFMINSNSEDRIIDSLTFHAFDNGIKIDNFLAQNNPLTNGVLVEVKSEDNVFQFLPIKSTQEFDAHFSFGAGRSFEIISASGNDSMVTRFGPSTPFIIKKTGTYASDDYIKVIIGDDLSSVASLRFLAFGRLDT